MCLMIRDGLWEHRRSLRTEIKLEYRKSWGQRGHLGGTQKYLGAKMGFREGRHEDSCDRTDFGGVDLVFGATKGWGRDGFRGSERSHREQIWGLRGGDGGKSVELGFGRTETGLGHQREDWGQRQGCCGVDKGLGSRNRYGGTRVSLCGEFRDRDKFGRVKVRFGAEVGFGRMKACFRGQRWGMVGRVKGSGEHRYLGRSGWEAGQREVGFGE